MTRVSAAEGYQLWAGSYDSNPNALLSLEWRKMSSLLSGFYPAQLIDVGCGTGRWALHFCRSKTKVTGIDASPSMLAHAAKYHDLAGRLVLGEAACLPVQAGIADLVLCSLALGYFRDLQQVFREFARVAAPAALIAITDLHPEAVEAGWSRSFQADGATYEIEHYLYPLALIKAAATEAGLRLKHCDDAYFGTPEFSLFQAAGKEGTFLRISKTPALFIGLWEKPC